MCFGCSKEPSHREGSFEYTQHMFCMRNKENSFPIHTLIWRPDNGHRSLCPLSMTSAVVLILLRTSDGGNGNHSVSLPIILIKIKVDQMLPSSYISSLLVSI